PVPVSPGRPARSQMGRGWRSSRPSARGEQQRVGCLRGRDAGEQLSQGGRGGRELGQQRRRRGLLALPQGGTRGGGGAGRARGGGAGLGERAGEGECPGWLPALGSISRARSRARCSRCWSSSGPSEPVSAGAAASTAWYREIMRVSPAMASRTTVTSGSGGGGV